MVAAGRNPISLNAISLALGNRISGGHHTRCMAARQLVVPNYCPMLLLSLEADCRLSSDGGDVDRGSPNTCSLRY